MEKQILVLAGKLQSKNRNQQEHAWKKRDSYPELTAPLQEWSEAKSYPTLLVPDNLHPSDSTESSTRLHRGGISNSQK